MFARPLLDKHHVGTWGEAVLEVALAVAWRNQSGPGASGGCLVLVVPPLVELGAAGSSAPARHQQLATASACPYVPLCAS